MNPDRKIASTRVVLAFIVGATSIGGGTYGLLNQLNSRNVAVEASPTPDESLVDNGNKLWPVKTPTVGPSVLPLRAALQNGFPAVESGAVRGGQVYDNNRFQRENINPHDPAAFMNFQTSCQDSPTRVVRKAQVGKIDFMVSRILDLFASKVEAASPETPEEFIKCIQDIEAQRPFLTSESAASEHDFKKINVGNLKPQDVIGIDTVANWQQKLVSELQKRGFDISQKEVDEFIASLQFTFRDTNTGKVGVFRPVFFQTQKEVDEKRKGGDLTARFIGEEVAVSVDPATGQMIWVEKNKSNVCDNESVPGPLKKTEATPTATAPAVPPSGESPSSTPTATIEATNTPTQVPATPTSQPATPTKAPTNIAPVPTETVGPTATIVPTRVPTPDQPTPTAIAAASPTAISAATPTAVGGAPSAPTAVKPGG
ncbi:hypothetical protein HY383_00480 [Candidatus Daviesbacteria bacterium]|nr:hypothetical protein [Candidatus Daviesbacteria bacterium]